MAIEIVDLPSYKMVDFSTSFFVCLPEGNVNVICDNVGAFLVMFISVKW